METFIYLQGSIKGKPELEKMIDILTEMTSVPLNKHQIIEMEIEKSIMRSQGSYAKLWINYQLIFLKFNI